VLVGDIEQSIFSFQGASADGCRHLADKQGLRTIETHAEPSLLTADL